ncbi:MAG: hypothetical protein M3141_02850 [Actinomycetota bacterium]|nr:hypothetical protein [Actinomycetota bacterium]
MERSRWERLAPLSGVLFVALLVASFLISGEPPDSDESLAEVLEYWRDDDSKVIASAILGIYGLVAFLWFLGALRSALRAAEGGTGRLSATAFAGGIVLAVGAAVGLAIQYAAAESAGDVPTQVTQTLSVLNAEYFIPFPVGLGVLLLATAVATIRHGPLPKWMGWVALVLGIAAITPAGFVAFIGFLPWVVIASIVLYLRPPAEAPGTTEPTAPASSRGSPS